MPAVCVMSYELMKDMEGAKAIEEGVSLLLVMFTLQVAAVIASIARPCPLLTVLLAAL